MKEKFTYTGSNTKEISFPLGGIGTGSIGLAGNGALVDWEIFNKPGKGTLNGFTHFAVRAEDEDGVLDARILQADLKPPYSGTYRNTWFFEGFGWGPRRETLAGLPHFKDAEFTGRFPTAELEFSGVDFPGEVSLEAFNPFIPLDNDNSSIPCAQFKIRLKNTQGRKLTYSVISSVTNPNQGPRMNSYRTGAGYSGLGLFSTLRDDSPDKRDLFIATDADEISYQEYWFRGPWFDNLEVYWKDMMAPGPFRNRSYSSSASTEEKKDEFKRDDTGLISASVVLEPGETREVRFVLAWYIPVNRNYWGRMGAGSTDYDTSEVQESRERTWKNYYATLWDSAEDVASYALRNWNMLEEKTKLFRDTIFSSTMPEQAIDAVTSTMSVLKSPTVLRLEDGTLYGWEGVGPDDGSCEGSCTHVWGYAQALAFLFPKLERSMRDAEYKYNYTEDGAMTFRLMLPLGSPIWHFRPCTDGQFVTIMKVFRDWKISGDTQWLKGLWPKIKKSLEWAWSEENSDRWDPEKTGILTGRQHHTLDMELIGPNSWLSGMYIGALKAASIMAQALGDTDAQNEYERIYRKGKEYLNDELFNGQYYVQNFDLSDAEALTSLPEAKGGILGGTMSEAYWSEEYGQVKYQLGSGLIIDQALAQWHCNLYGIGEVFEQDKLKTAMESLFKHNFVPEFREYYNPCRIYSLNDEAGLVICSWPDNAEKPAIPIPYSQETMNGFEYAAAVLMMQTGLVDEGAKVIRSVRERYDGERRNPWNEFECGSNYARSMAAYSILNAYSGFIFDVPNKMIGFKPLSDGMYFWCLNHGWGTYTQNGQSGSLVLKSGEIEISQFKLERPNKIAEIKCNERTVEFEVKEGVIILGECIRLLGQDEAMKSIDILWDE